jgi:hypothetical protein
MIHISYRIREAHPECGRSSQPQAGNQKTIFLPKSCRELEQDPCKFKAGKEWCVSKRLYRGHADSTFKYPSK